MRGFLTGVHDGHLVDVEFGQCGGVVRSFDVVIQLSAVGQLGSRRIVVDACRHALDGDVHSDGVLLCAHAAAIVLVVLVGHDEALGLAAAAHRPRGIGHGVAQSAQGGEGFCQVTLVGDDDETERFWPCLSGQIAHDGDGEVVGEHVLQHIVIFQPQIVLANGIHPGHILIAEVSAT